MTPGSIGTPSYIGGIAQAPPPVEPMSWVPCSMPGARSADGAMAMRSCASIREDGERPRTTSGPERSATSADASAVTQRRYLLKATSPSSLRPSRTSPSLTTGSSSSGVAHATYAA